MVASSQPHPKFLHDASDLTTNRQSYTPMSGTHKRLYEKNNSHLAKRRELDFKETQLSTVDTHVGQRQ